MPTPQSETGKANPDDLLRRVREWASGMGGWDAPIWTEISEYLDGGE